MTMALKALMDWRTHPRRIVEVNDPIILTGDSADTLFYIETGAARAGDGSCFSAGEFILLCETLALDIHKLSVKAAAPCQLVCLRPRLKPHFHRKAILPGRCLVRLQPT